MNTHDLAEMARIEFDEIGKDKLTDIQSLEIKTAMSAEQKLQLYVDVMKNPYLYKVGNTPVRLRYINNGKTLHEVLERYFVKQKRGE